MQTFIVFLPILLFAAYGIAGYWFLRAKGYRKWWNLSLIISCTPLFWFAWAIVKPKDKSKDTTTISAIAAVWGAINLAIILYAK